MSGDEDSPGARIARARRRRGLAQSVLAGLVGRSESWLSQVERGKRGVDSYVVLTRMAEVLRVEVEELTGPGGVGADNLCHQAVFVDDATYAVVPPDPEMIQVGDAIWQRP